MFHGLSAFPPTPLNDDSSVDQLGYGRFVKRLVAAEVDSIGALGSTGGYAYLPREERKHALQVAVAEAGAVPVIGGIGGLRTDDVLRHADDAQEAGVSAVLLAPMSYTPLTADEVFGLYEDVTANLSVPLCVYDNPSTTHFTFTDELYQRVAALPGVGAIKIPSLPADEIEERIAALRTMVPESVKIGVSGDWFAADGLAAGADAWFSVIAGIFPKNAREITAAASAAYPETARQISQRLEPIWDLFRAHGSVRVVAAAAQFLGLAGNCLQRPLRPLDDATYRHLGRVINDLGLGD